MPGIFGYSFIVDGQSMLDPIKPEREPDESELEVTSNPPQLTQWQEVEHGMAHLHYCFSLNINCLRQLRVYTPPGYDADQASRFPVRSLLDGTGDTEATWSEFGRANLIEDNLVAVDEALPLIIVMADGHADLTDEGGIGSRNLERM